MIILRGSLIRSGTLTNEKRELWYKLKETFLPSLTVLSPRYPDKAEAVNESLPRDLEAQMFFFFDQLDGTRKESSARSEGALLIPLRPTRPRSMRPRRKPPRNTRFGGFLWHSANSIQIPH